MSLSEMVSDLESPGLEVLGAVESALQQTSVSPREGLRRALNALVAHYGAEHAAVAIVSGEPPRARLEIGTEGAADAFSQRLLECACGAREKVWEDDRVTVRAYVPIASRGRPIGALGLQLSAAAGMSPHQELALLSIVAGLLRPTLLRLLSANEEPPLAAPSISSGHPIARATWVACSHRSQEVRAFLRELENARTTVLVRGESGSGKTLIARLLAAHGPTARGPRIEIACDALTADQRAEGPTGWCSRARAGTLILDRIAELEPALQAELVHALPAAETARVIAVTTADLEAASRGGSFREDLYHRLSGFELLVPPLREREGDLAPLIEQLLDGAGSSARVTPAALACLAAYDWPGNVRELESVVTRAALLSAGAPVEPRALPPELRLRGRERTPDDAPLDVQMHDFERRLIIEALRTAGGRQAAAARELQISPRALAYRMRRLGIAARG